MLHVNIKTQLQFDQLQNRKPFEQNFCWVQSKLCVKTKMNQISLFKLPLYYLSLFSPWLAQGRYHLNKDREKFTAYCKK